MAAVDSAWLADAAHHNTGLHNVFMALNVSNKGEMDSALYLGCKSIVYISHHTQPWRGTISTQKATRTTEPISMV